MVIQPNAFATELNRMISANTGQRYWIMTRKIFFLRKRLSPWMISSSIFATPMTLETRRQVAMAAIGIITEFVRKSKEIQELHAKNGDGGKRSVAKAGERSERNHDNADQNGRFFTAPAELILKGGNGAFCQCNGAGQCGKQHQKEKQNTDHSAKAHIGEYLRDGDKHQGRSCLQGIRISAGEGKDGRNDHQACHDRDGSVKDFDVACGILDRGVFFM